MHAWFAAMVVQWFHAVSRCKFAEPWVENCSGMTLRNGDKSNVLITCFTPETLKSCAHMHHKNGWLISKSISSIEVVNIWTDTSGT